MTDSKIKRRKLFAGWYQVSGARVGSPYFSNLRRESNGWHVDVRDSKTGSLVRFAGIWNTLREAQEEAEFHILPRSL